MAPCSNPTRIGAHTTTLSAVAVESDPTPPAPAPHPFPSLPAPLPLALLPRRRRDPIRQVLLIVLSCYLSSGIAEYLGLSGTLTLLICALVISHYGTRNLGKQVTT